jgi:hypothetical protein
MRQICYFVFLLIIAFSTGSTSFAADPKIQAIHGMADPSLNLVDVEINAKTIFGTFPVDTLKKIPFRSASEMIQEANSALVPVKFDVHISDGYEVFTFEKQLKNDKVYIGIIYGVINPAQFAPNPNGIGTNIGVLINDKARDKSDVPGNVEFFMFNAISDAPALRLKLKDGESLVDSIMFSIHHSNYVSLPPATYVFELLDSAKDSVIATYTANLSEYADRSFALYATGFLEPSLNQNGARFELTGVFPDGSFINFEEIDPTDIYTERDNIIAGGFSLYQNYPNPFNPVTTIQFNIPESEEVQLSIFNTSGQKIVTLLNRRLTAGLYKIDWNAGDLPSGVYFYSLKTKSFNQTKKLMLLR